MKAQRWGGTGLCVAACVAACVAGYRGKAAFRGDHALAGIEEVRITLPDTPIDLVACTPVPDDPELCPETLRYRGIWDAVGGTARDAEDHAAAPTLALTREQGFASLSATVPLSVAGLVDLEMETIALPDDRDVQIFGGVGDVAVDGPRATVTVVVEVGDVSVLGGDQGVAVNTGLGDVTLVTAGHADVRTGAGAVTVEQTSGARDLWVQTQDGDIQVTLGSDADVALSIRAPGRIHVDTPQITTVTRGAFERRLGTGAVQVTLSTGRGSVTVQGP